MIFLEKGKKSLFCFTKKFLDSLQKQFWVKNAEIGWKSYVKTQV